MVVEFLNSLVESASPILLIVLAVGALVYAKIRYGYKYDRVSKEVISDLASLYRQSLKEQEMLSKEIQQQRTELRQIAAKSRSRERLLQELVDALEQWKENYPPQLEEIKKVLERFKNS